MDYKELIPKRIQQARISRELDTDELAKVMNMAFKFDLTERDILRYERGLEEPDDHVLRVMAHILDFPIAFFYKPMPVHNTADGPLFICRKINEGYRLYDI